MVMMLNQTRVGTITPDGRALVYQDYVEYYKASNVRSLQLWGDRIGVLSGATLWVSEGPPDADCVLQRNDVYSFQLHRDWIAVLTLTGELYVKEGPPASGGWVFQASAVRSYQMEDFRIGIITQDGRFLEKLGLHGTWVELLAPYLLNPLFRSFQLSGNRGAACKQEYDVLMLWENMPVSMAIACDSSGADLVEEKSFSTGSLVSYQIKGNRLGVLTKAGRLYLLEGSLRNNFVKVADDAAAFQLEGDHIGYLNQEGVFAVKRGALTAPWKPIGTADIAGDWQGNAGNDAFQLQAHEDKIHLAVLRDFTLFTSPSVDYQAKAGWWTQFGYEDFCIVGGRPTGQERGHSAAGKPYRWPVAYGKGDIMLVGPPPPAVTQGANQVGDWYTIHRKELTAGKQYTFALAQYGQETGVRFAMLLLKQPDAEPVPCAEEWLFNQRGQPLPSAQGASAEGPLPLALTYTPQTSGTYYLHVWTYPAEGGWIARGAYRLLHPASPFIHGIHSYPFANFEGKADEALFREVFNLGSAPLSAIQQEYYQYDFVDKYGGGVCYGIAVTAGMFYRGVYGPTPGSFKAGATQAAQLERDEGDDLDEPLERHIAKYYYFQYGAEMDRAIVYCTSHEAADQIKQAIRDGWTDPLILCYRLGFGQGHAVSVVGLHPDCAAQGVSIFVYDNNSPYAAQWVSTGTPLPPADRYSIQDVAAYIGTAVHEQDHIPLPYGGGGGGGGAGGKAVSLALTPQQYILHRDSAGRRLGTPRSGDALAEIPGAYRIIPITGNLNPNWQPPIEYYLPRGGDYSIELRQPQAGPLGYELFSGDTLVKFQTVTAVRWTASRIKTDRQAGGFSFSTDRTRQRVTAKIFREPQGQPQRSYELSYTTPHRGQNMVLATSESGDSLQLRLEGAYHDPYQLDYSLTLTQNSPQPASTTLQALAISKGASQTVTVWDWSRLNSMPIFVQMVKANGQRTVIARQTTPENRNLTLNDMLARGWISDQAVLDRLRADIAQRTIRTVRKHLSALAAQGAVSSTASELIAALAAASQE